MDIVSVLISFNKISLIAFLITLGFIVYEIYLFKKDSLKKSKPVIPEFNENTSPNAPQVITVVTASETKSIKRPSKLPLVLGTVLLLVFGIISAMGFVNVKSAGTNVVPTKMVEPMVNFVTAKGIKIFDENWRVLSDDELAALTPGQKIIIGIDAVSGADIDRARIRINDDQWKLDHVSLDFDKGNNVFYKEYLMATGESSLQIEAQLHSEEDGWLGD
jgi:hypothetical protein